MSDGATHLVTSAAGAALLAAIDEYHCTGEISAQTIGAAIVGGMTARLPDILEPALRNPHHRQFFHSVVFAGIVGYGVYRAYKWEPQDATDEFLRFVFLAVGTSYVIHLVCDSTTPRGLPIVGKL